MSAELQQTKLILNTLTRIRAKALEMGRRKTTNGENIDEHQVHTERLAYLATEVEAAAAALDYAVKVDEAGADHNNLHSAMALGFTAEVAQKYFGQITAHTGDYGFNQAFLEPPKCRGDRGPRPEIPPTLREYISELRRS